MMTGQSQRWQRASLLALALSLAVHAGLLALLAAVLVTALVECAHVAAQFQVQAFPIEAPPPLPIEVPLAENPPEPSGTPLLPAVVDQPALTEQPQIALPIVGGAPT